MGILNLRTLCVICLLSGVLSVLFSATPQGKSLEEYLGLSFLFKVRGNREVPNEALIYAIERKSAEFFGLKQQPHKWPRTLHAQTIDLLTDRNVAAIGLDMFFEETRSSEHDQILARAMRESGRVVLLQRLKKTTDFSGADSNNSIAPFRGLHSEQLIPPVPSLEKEAAALAPFPLPKLPVRLNQAWLFKEGAGDKATLPVVMFAMYMPQLLDKFVELIRLAAPSNNEIFESLLQDPIEFQRIDNFLQKLKATFLSESGLAVRMKTFLTAEKSEKAFTRSEQHALSTMINLFEGDRSIFINYYGPPGTINTIPYYKLFQEEEDSSASDLHNNAVFIGLTHDAEMAEKDGFYTVYTDQEGKHISGVEVAATVFANLVDGSVITSIHSLYTIIIIFALGISSGAISHALNPMMAGVACFCLCLACVSIACLLFAYHHLWMPFVVSIALQIPLTYLVVTLYKNKKTVENKKNIQQALQCYIPKSIVNQLEQDFSLITSRRDVVYGICLYSDLENYTVLSENLDHQELTQLINSYYEEMFHVVKHYSGMVLDIRGDSMLALWPNNSSGHEPVDQACEAAYTISRIFNNPDSPAAHHLPTRIGLHQGSISVGNIGALDRYQYTITGDTVNTVARIESLTKQLGTRLLVSEIIAQKAAFSEFRKIGTFLFVGKSQPLSIYELVGRKGQISEEDHKLSLYFARGLENFQEGRWAKSKEMFELCTSVCAKYGPALWFQEKCKSYMVKSNDIHWDGVIRLENK